MKLGVLECGNSPSALVARFGRYGTMVSQSLGLADSTIFDVTAGRYPTDIETFHAFVLTGSPAGVHDPYPWIAELVEFLQRVRGRSRLVGICFGHQIMAHAFGGAVARSPAGWSLGLHAYDVVHRRPWMDGEQHVQVSAYHQDQVVISPPGAQVTVASDLTPIAGLDYGDAISFQFHPEFGAAFGRALIASQEERFGPLTEAALASYDARDDAVRVRRWIRRFLEA